MLVLCPLTLVSVYLGCQPHPVGPQPSLLFSSGTLPHFADHISVNVELRFGAVVIASTSLSFYDCVAVTASSPSAP